MTDREMFKKAFEPLHASPEILAEVLEMEAERTKAMKRRTGFTRLAAAVAVLVLILGCSTAAYAMDIGGIQRMVQVWIHGEQTNAVMTFENGTYDLHIMNEDGTQEHRGGGGVAFNSDGTERPLTEEELMEHLDSPEVDYKEDGTRWVYYRDQKLEITDSFENGVCFVKVGSGKDTVYMTIKEDGSYAMSPHRYEQPDTFN